MNKHIHESQAIKFDIRTADSAYEFVTNILNISGQNFIMTYCVECGGDFERLWMKYACALDNNNADEIRIYGFHVLGSLDNCAGITTLGLLNLQKVLSMETAVSSMLKNHGVWFDIENHFLNYDNRKFRLNFFDTINSCSTSEFECNLWGVARKIYYDYAINGFLYCNDPANYGTEIHQRPEFILNLVSAFPELKSLETEWIKNATSYRVDFFVYPNQLAHFMFDLSEINDPPYEDWNTLNYNQKIIKRMLHLAIDRSFRRLSDRYLHMDNFVTIPPKQIISIEKL